MAVSPAGGRRAAWLALSVVGAALLLPAGTGSAQPPGMPAAGPAPARSVVTHPAADHLGSTVRAHSGPAAGGTAPGPAALSAGAGPLGMDVSSWQGSVDWPAAARNGAQFAYVKATEDTGYVNPSFGQQYDGSYAAGLLRGAYHFAIPNNSDGPSQADYFLGHGGGWSADGHTLPPMLDIEYNPYGPTCYGLTAGQMSSWIRGFSTTVQARTGRYPVVYTTADWWDTCTGGDSSFGSTNPLFVARYAASPGVMPAGWAQQQIWQYADHGTNPGDADLFNGTDGQLQQFAVGSLTGPDPITVRYDQLGGAGSMLGQPVGQQYPISGGVGRDYQYGRLYYTPATGAWLVRGSILDRYLALGGPAGRLGVPVTDELTTPGGVGRYNHFSGSGGSIYWSPTTGPAEIQGAIRSLWVAYRWEQGLLGFPTTDELTTPDGVGRYNHFSGTGGSIYWTPATGPHEVQGSIAALWAALGWERGALGYPTSDEYGVTGGRQSDFQHGTVAWTAATGVLRVTYR